MNTKNQLTHAETAATLNGLEEHEVNYALDDCRKDFLFVFGASDDLNELRGMIHDEVSAYDGTVFRVTPEGVLEPWDELEVLSEKEAEDYFRRKMLPYITIKSTWCEGDGACWKFETDAKSFSKFVINEDGEPFSEGLVIDVSKL